MDMNMDVKDLFAKLKKGGDKKGKKSGGNGFVRFFEKNPKMKVIIPSIFVLIAVIVAVVFIVTGIKTDTETDGSLSEPAGAKVDVLPMLERPQGEALEDGANPFDEDAIANAKLTGTIYNRDGYYTATVATEHRSYVLQVGDYVAESEWLVESITENSITFSMGEKKRTVEMKDK